MQNPVIIDQAGPLPISVTVQWPSSNRVMMAMSGSASAQAPSTRMMVTATISSPSTVIGTLSGFANEAGTHLAFPTVFSAVNNGGPGEFTLTLSAAKGTLTDSNDHFTVALIY